MIADPQKRVKQLGYLEFRDDQSPKSKVQSPKNYVPLFRSLVLGPWPFVLAFGLWTLDFFFIGIAPIASPEPNP
jgi:hypothetical protein